MAKDDQQKQVFCIFCILSFHENSTNYSDVNHFHIMHPTKDCQYDYYNASVNGLVTFKTETGIVIWNPTIKEHITLPQPKISKHVRCFLGYDPKENTYKILSIDFCKTWEKYQKHKILTLGSQESWRVITNSPDHYPRRGYYCINGVVYYRAYITYEEYHKIYPPFIKEIELDMRLNEIIMSFDVRSEQFKSIELPARANQYESKLDESLMTYQGKLAWVCYNSNMIKLWVLQDLEKQEWSKNEFVLPNLPQRDLLGSAKLSGATSTGEFIYVSGKYFKDISVFYYDPVRETITSVNGLEYEKFRSCYGSNNDEMACLRSYPNHIENLMSLRNIMCSPIV
ncbi:unnamed protein product [Arabidopsis lyrata]|uniref:F-box associated beta-propeller type 3 domain-containing protein n=2 Tax=Arabidopsis lyrata subsp. lyrata TaxID=81972 RepID=D7MVF9_ARALL|nr:hypothetical protein ARALYDRAFT_333028 [Arabidopsis lyrata subsp. lyrata]CAH8276981.1 unnamed protein product [Arabidopsis lyrata]